jgi:hypothetical protein
MADDITQRLGLDASAAISSLRQLRVLFSQYAQSVRAAADANAQFNKSGRLVTQALQADVTAMTGAQKQIGSLTTQTKRLVQQLNARIAAQNKLNSAGTGPKAVSGGGASTDVASTFAATLASNLLSRAIFATTTALKDATSAAIEYELTLARIQTIAGADVASISQLGGEVRALSDAFGLPALEVAAGLYDLLSNQVGSAAEATQIFTSALKLANVTGASTSESVNAISSVINT